MMMLLLTIFLLVDLLCFMQLLSSNHLLSLLIIINHHFSSFFWIMYELLLSNHLFCKSGWRAGQGNLTLPKRGDEHSFFTLDKDQGQHWSFLWESGAGAGMGTRERKFAQTLPCNLVGFVDVLIVWLWEHYIKYINWF